MIAGSHSAGNAVALGDGLHLAGDGVEGGLRCGSQLHIFQAGLLMRRPPWVLVVDRRGQPTASGLVEVEDVDVYEQVYICASSWRGCCRHVHKCMWKGGHVVVAVLGMRTWP